MSFEYIHFGIVIIIAELLTQWWSANHILSVVLITNLNSRSLSLISLSLETGTFELKDLPLSKDLIWQEF